MTSQSPENPSILAGSPERRSHGCVHVLFETQSVIYAELGDATFGIVTNISEDGLAMQTVRPVTKATFMCSRARRLFGAARGRN
jgi:hypothetical protein